LPEKNHKETKGGIRPPFIVVIVDFNEAKFSLKNTQGVAIYERKKKKKMLKAYFAKKKKKKSCFR
jgi:hypothetical protein